MYVKKLRTPIRPARVASRTLRTHNSRYKPSLPARMSATTSQAICKGRSKTSGCNSLLGEFRIIDQYGLPGQGFGYWATLKQQSDNTGQ
eukprot:6214218-Pleurochrysis_carterae.AAC.4